MSTKLKEFTAAEIPLMIAEATGILGKNPSKRGCRIYPFGFVPSAYGYPAPAQRFVMQRENGELKYHLETYDQKRRFGRGSRVVLF